MTTQEGASIPTPVRVHGLNGDHLKPHRCTIRHRVFYGFLTLHYDPQDLRICVRTGDKVEHMMRLPWVSLAHAHELDGEAAAVHFDETRLDGEVVDRTVFAMRDVDPGLVRDSREVRRELEAYWEENGIQPKTGHELLEELRATFDSDEERQDYVERMRELFPANPDGE